MNNALIVGSQNNYKEAEIKAREYFKRLYKQYDDKMYVNKLTEDIERWKDNHISKNYFISLLSRRNSISNDYKNYIEWLDKRGKLSEYLNRSISYIFMRDLGKDLSLPSTIDEVNAVVKDIEEHITRCKKDNRKEDNMVSTLYRKAQKEGIEDTVIWLIEKLATVFRNIPDGMDIEQAKRKLIKIIAGVIMHQVEELEEKISSEERREKLEAAIRLGYYYGLTYPFIDDLLDSKVLSEREKKDYSNLIRETLLTREVAKLEKWHGENEELIRYIYSELKEAFEYIKEYQNEDTIESFFRQSYIFFNSQEVDREKDLSNSKYSNEEIYIPVILKSSSSRLIVRSVISAKDDSEFESRTFYYGIYNQLADDFTDMYDDMENGSVTPYTYYMKYYGIRKDLVNPFKLYWTVIYNLIHNVYNSDLKTCEVILSRAINSLKRFKERVGIDKYNEVMSFFDFKDDEFSKLIHKMGKKAENVEFFDKLIRDYMNEVLRKEKEEQDEFKNSINKMQKEIDTLLKIDNEKNNNEIINAANYAIEGNGKRLRPIMSWNMGVNAFRLNEDYMMPLIKSIEYMHTASLIFDDLPSQDNAIMRRGHETLHKVYNTATAELTGIFLIQKAVEEQSLLKDFDSKIVLKLIRYSAETTEKMCMGQSMDLGSKHKKLNLEELKDMCFHKTGLAFEASLIMPAILGNASSEEIKALKEFAYYSGITFQIKDDILDAEGDSKILGKIAGKDVENNNSTFVTVLGIKEAKKEMWDNYCKSIEALQKIQRNIKFLKYLMNYIVNRER